MDIESFKGENRTQLYKEVWGVVEQVELIGIWSNDSYARKGTIGRNN